MITILLVEDDRHLRKLMAYHLEREGYTVLMASNGVEALEMIETTHVDLMISDVMMPEKDGFALTREIRGTSGEFPILMVTARERLDDKKQGFSAGADDYMVKPVEMEEMLLRVDALLRRSKIQTDRKIVVGSTVLDYDTLMVERPGESIELPKKEFYLLFKLLSYPKQIFTRQQLMDDVWGYDSLAEERTVDVHIKRLCEKFEKNQDFSIITIRGLGYKAEKNEII